MKSQASILAKQRLLRWLHDHDLEPHDRLPSRQRLASMLRVSVSALAMAVDELESSGVLQTVARSGTYFLHHPSDCTTESNQDDDVLPEPHNAPSKIVYGALRKLSNERISRASVVKPPIGLVLNESWSLGSRLLTSGFHTHYAKSGRDVLMAETDRTIHGQAEAVLSLANAGVAGMFLSILPGTPASHVSMPQRMGIPVVVYGNTPPVPAPRITADPTRVATAFARMLLEHGHDRVGACLTIMNNFWRAMIDRLSQELGTPLDEELIHVEGNEYNRHADFVLSRETFLIDRVLSAKTPPTALITSSDSDASQLLWSLENLGVKVPQDISVLTAACRERQGAESRSCAAVQFDLRWVGTRSAQLIEEMINGRRATNEHHVEYMETTIDTGSTLMDLNAGRVRRQSTSDGSVYHR